MTAAPEEQAHGGRLGEARRLFPAAPEPWVDLSTGINPLPYPLPPLPDACFTRLPEPEQEAALLSAAADAYGTTPDLLAAAPGTQALIELLPRLFPARRVAVLGPTYAEHAAAWRRGGAEVSVVAAPEEIAGADAAVLCNPNNPDGRRFAPDALTALADRVGLLVVDAAFADLEDSALVPPPHPRVIVLRSFGKTYGLAGVRLGFAATPRAAAIRAALGPWAVSGPALAVGTVALADAAWRAAAAARLAAECATLDAWLRAAGLRVLGGTRLFRLAEGDPAWFARLGAAGIFVRRFADRPGWLRFGLPGTPAAWDRLRRALAG